MFKYHLESCSFLEIFIFVFVFADRSALKIREEDFTYPPIQVRGIFKSFVFLKSIWLHV